MVDLDPKFIRTARLLFRAWEIETIKIPNFHLKDQTITYEKITSFNKVVHNSKKIKNKVINTLFITFLITITVNCKTQKEYGVLMYLMVQIVCSSKNILVGLYQPIPLLLIHVVQQIIVFLGKIMA